MKKMKFLLGALSFVAAAFMVSPSQAQIKTYISENFSNGLNTSVWDLDACTDISKEEGPLYFLQQGSDILGGWVYDPNGIILTGGVQTQLNGMYEIVAKPIQLESNAINIISVNYTYAAQSSGTRSFGIRIKEEGSSEWTELTKLTSLGTSKDGTLIASLDSKWNGKTVVMEVYFSAQHKANSAYYFLMGNIEFAAYSQDPTLSTKITAAPIAYPGKEFDVKLSITNTGAIAVSSFEYTYVIDNNAKTDKISANFTQALDPLIGMAGGSVPVDVEGLSFGEHTLKFYPSKINGEEITGGKEESLVFYIVDESQFSQQYVPLFEEFTSSTCSPCATANTYLNPALSQLQNAGAINVIKYQMYFPGNGDPYYIAENQTRMLYYDGIFGWDGYWSVPSPIYNGMEFIMDWDAQYWSDLTNQLIDKATDGHKKKAAMTIDITNAEINASNQLMLEIEITPHLSMTGNVHTVIVEKTTTGNRRTNGEKEFHNVAMKFATDATGKKTSFEAGKKEKFRYSVSMDQTNVEEMHDLQVVCFVQDPESGYIFQSSSIVKSGNVSNENEVMGDVRVYPNPASEFVNITNLEGADVEIFDLTGRRVYVNNKVEGDLEVSLASFANGTYVVRLTKDGQSAHRKLIVVR